MQAKLDDFAPVFATMDFPLMDDSAIPEEEYMNLIFELRDCLMSEATPEELNRWGDCCYGVVSRISRVHLILF